LIAVGGVYDLFTDVATALLLYNKKDYRFFLASVGTSAITIFLYGAFCTCWIIAQNFVPKKKPQASKQNPDATKKCLFHEKKKKKNYCTHTIFDVFNKKINTT